jgi:hypothetical protein
VVLDPPHIVTIIDDRFLDMTVGFRDLIRGKLERMAGEGTQEDAGEAQAREEGVAHDGYPITAGIIGVQTKRNAWSGGPY